MIKIHFSTNNFQEQLNIKIDHQGSQYTNLMPKNLSTKKQWNSKFTIGRSVLNYSGEKITCPKLNSTNALSRKHAKIDLKRAFTTHYIPYKFILYILCLKKIGRELPEDLLRIISKFYFKPRTYTSLSGMLMQNYVLIKDLNSTLGTLIKIRSSLLNSCEEYMLSDSKLTIEKVKNEGILYEDGKFFRGIPMDHICIIHMNYMGNVDEDRGLQDGECGFPYIRCIFNGIKYFLIATEAKYKFFLGRYEFCDIFIEQNSVSRMQCIIEYDCLNHRWIIHDGNPDENKKSFNGTYKVLRGGPSGSDWVVAECNEIQISNVKIKISY